MKKRANSGIFVRKVLRITNDEVKYQQVARDDGRGSAAFILACTKHYYFDVADDSRVCYVEKDFSSKGICRNLYGGVQCLHNDILKLRNPS